MSELDLIPQSYRQLLRLRRWLRNFIVLYGAVVLCVVTGKAFLSHGIDAHAAEIKKLRADKTSILSRKAQLERLASEKAVIQKQLAVLEKLRGGPAAKRIFVSLDRALDEGVWFLHWKFMRAGEFVPLKRQGVQTGYFIVIPDQEERDERAWHMRTHMEIKAQALDHSALAAFVTRLTSEPLIADVKVLNTRIQRTRGKPVVDFDLAVVVDEHPGLG